LAEYSLFVGPFWHRPFSAARNFCGSHGIDFALYFRGHKIQKENQDDLKQKIFQLNVFIESILDVIASFLALQMVETAIGAILSSVFDMFTSRFHIIFSLFEPFLRTISCCGIFSIY
jgi:uncharacterized protein YqhQ